MADEFVYLAGARRFADTQSLDSTYYFADSILAAGFPHQDAHSPGYVMVLGLAARILGPGYWSAVALNLASLLIALGLLWSLARRLGRPREVRLLTMAAVSVPALFPYASWVMPEWLVVAASLTTLLVAVRWGMSPRGAVLCGLSLGVCVLIRESGIFLLPALVLLVGASRLRLSLLAGSFLAFCVLVFAPLNARRPPVVTTTVSGTAGNTGAYRALGEGRIREAAAHFVKRAERNLSALPKAGYEQQLSLLLMLVIPALSWASWCEMESRARLALIGLSAGLGAMVVATLIVSDIVNWNGPRYWTILGVAFFPLLPTPRLPARRLALSLVVALSVITTISVLFTFLGFKSQGQGSPVDEIAYFDQYAPPGSYSRVIWQNGYRLGLARYPAEVIVSIPQSPEEYRALERRVWFDYVVLSNWQDVLDTDRHYALVNQTDPKPLLKIFRRLM
jgi:4-amino-4-deoxy-L-arabinose transferase-like glycosyltransferase